MIALFGGTFNPPHLGHVQLVTAAAQQLGLSAVALMPCKVSPLKDRPNIADGHRLAMLALVCEECSTPELAFSIEDMELSLPSPSYTVNTLRQIRQSRDAQEPVFFFLGDDSLYTLHKWREWERLLDYCHIVTLPRQTQLKPPAEVSQWLAQHKTDTVSTLHAKPHGCVFQCQADNVSVSSTQVRETLIKGSAVPDGWISARVLAYINQHKLYA